MNGGKVQFRDNSADHGSQIPTTCMFMFPRKLTYYHTLVHTSIISGGADPYIPGETRKNSIRLILGVSLIIIVSITVSPRKSLVDISYNIC